ncbi:hypothetical protein [Streptomyces rubrogriseus]|uniref:hypothetical protein n=1 Tax=Streptomyces rubrogriseus TaxID=194673 RepID=UPI001EF176B2|nr:hypothetical protein [Streptomyces rubrogriseus]
MLSAAVVGSGELITTTALGAKAGFALLWLVGGPVDRGQGLGPDGTGPLDRPHEAGPFHQAVLAGLEQADRGERDDDRPQGQRTPAQGVADDRPQHRTGGRRTADDAAALEHLGEVHADPEPVDPAQPADARADLAVALPARCARCLAVGLPGTEFGYGTSELGGGFGFEIPAGTIGIALAVFGITSVDADEMTTYTYWCLEKGYARWTGPDDGSEERARRAAGGIKVMRLDAVAGLVVCVLCTLSFYVIGAAVLHPQGLVPEGNEMITTLSRIYTDTMGPWACSASSTGATSVPAPAPSGSSPGACRWCGPRSSCGSNRPC